MGNFKGAVRAWNGGTNALCDREALTAGNDPIIKRLDHRFHETGLMHGIHLASEAL